MSEEAARLIGAFQLLVAIAAILAAPGLAGALYSRLRAQMLAICRPLIEDANELAAAWQVDLSTHAEMAEGFTVSIFPAKQGNRVSLARIMTDPDGGLQFDGSIVEGGLKIAFARFHRRREFVVQVQFEQPDVPVLRSSLGPVRRRFDLTRQQKRVPQIRNELLYQRLALVYYLFNFWYLIVIGRLLFGAITGQ